MSYCGLSSLNRPLVDICNTALCTLSIEGFKQKSDSSVRVHSVYQYKTPLDIHCPRSYLQPKTLNYTEHSVDPIVLFTDVFNMNSLHLTIGCHSLYQHTNLNSMCSTINHYFITANRTLKVDLIQLSYIFSCRQLFSQWHTQIQTIQWILVRDRYRNIDSHSQLIHLVFVEVCARVTALYG